MDDDAKVPPIEWAMDATAEVVGDPHDGSGYAPRRPLGRIDVELRLRVGLPRPCPTCGGPVADESAMVLMFHRSGRLAAAYCSPGCVPPAGGSWRDRPPLL